VPAGGDPDQSSAQALQEFSVGLRVGTHRTRWARRRVASRGGHSLPKDPWLLIANAGDGFRPRLIPAARAINDGMPLHVADLVVDALREVGREIAGAKVAVLGYAYLGNSDDTRNSPSKVLVERLRELGAEVVTHDPWVREYRGEVLERVDCSDAVALMVAHQAYRQLDLSALGFLLRTPILIDGRGVFDAKLRRAAGLLYWGVGRGNHRRSSSE
jgi:UDP-N-acetyl-D-mannosaminuronic acid dehydrogenase